jgi:hypothetical protein
MQNEYSTRGRGYWKFNTDLLHAKIYVDEINFFIKTQETELSKYNDKGLVWEIVKLKIRSFSIPYCIKKKKERNKLKKQLENELESLQILLDENNNDTNILENFNTSKKELEIIDNETTNNIIFRSKSKYIEDGEKNTKFFLNLEKKNYLNRLISSLDINGTLTSDPQKIAIEQTNFYQALYQEKLSPNSHTYTESENIFFNNIEHPVLNSIQCNFCENDLNEAEILRSLKELKNGKTPGTDGLPPEFYKLFWADIKTFVTESLQYALSTNELSVEQKRGIINLIPKKTKNRILLKKLETNIFTKH